MKKLILFLIISATTLTTNANSNCFGSENLYTCTDPKTGNSHQISKLGNTTQVNSYNSRTGTTWSQNTQTYGNQSYTTGRDQHGNSWQHNTNQIGNSQYYNGNDSKGNSYSGNCNPYTGCSTTKFGQ